MTNTTDTLAPCPFCGGKGFGPYGGPDGAWIECDDVDCLTEVHGTSREDAIRSWNRRAPTQSPPGDELREALEELDHYKGAFDGEHEAHLETKDKYNLLQRRSAELVNAIEEDAIPLLAVAHGYNSCICDRMRSLIDKARTPNPETGGTL